MQKHSFSIHPVEEEQEQGQEQEHEQGEGGGERVQRLRRSIEKMLTRLQGPSVEESSGSKETERGSKNSEEREERGTPRRGMREKEKENSFASLGSEVLNIVDGRLKAISMTPESGELAESADKGAAL